ncbi:MAG: ribulose-phosphate 3-epimerase [Candidatus Thorarchaeota archaeon]
MKKVAVSIHATENFNPKIMEGLVGFDYIHVDIMDGKYVNNKNDNLKVIRVLRGIYKTPIIVHLMVINPISYIKKIHDSSDFFIFHFENDINIEDILEEVKKLNKKAGIALNPETEVSEIVPYLKKVDLVLVMSVKPGFSGQKFIPLAIKKVNQLAKIKDKYKFIIDIDGGINLTNAKLLRNTDILTSSSSILNSKFPNRTIQLLKESDEND